MSEVQSQTEAGTARLLLMLVVSQVTAVLARSIRKERFRRAGSETMLHEVKHVKKEISQIQKENKVGPPLHQSAVEPLNKSRMVDNLQLDVHEVLLQVCSVAAEQAAALSRGHVTGQDENTEKQGIKDGEKEDGRAGRGAGERGVHEEKEDGRVKVYWTCPHCGGKLRGMGTGSRGNEEEEAHSQVTRGEFVLWLSGEFVFCCEVRFVLCCEVSMCCILAAFDVDRQGMSKHGLLVGFAGRIRMISFG